MTQRERRARLRALWGIQDSTDAAFRERVMRAGSIIPELRLLARHASIDDQRDELDAIIGFLEMELGVHAQDRGRAQCAADRHRAAMTRHKSPIRI